MSIPAFTAVIRLSTINPTGTLRSRIPTILPMLTGALAMRARNQIPKKLKRIIAKTKPKTARGRSLLAQRQSTMRSPIG